MGKHLSVHRHSQLAQFSVDVFNISQMDFRRVTDGDDSVREIRISCPDATGLGCDIARMLLDFGLKILSGWARVPAASCASALSSQGHCPQESVHNSTAAAADTACVCGAGDVSTDGKWCFLIIKVIFVGSRVWQLPCSCCCPLTMSRPPKLVSLSRCMSSQELPHTGLRLGTRARAAATCKTPSPRASRQYP